MKLRAFAVAALCSCAFQLLGSCQLATGLDSLHVGDAGIASSSSGVSVCEPSLLGADCDPVDQCGCGTGAACRVVITSDSNTLTALCGALGDSHPDGTACIADSDCAVGSGCLDGLCKKYCKRDGDCGNGSCQPITIGSATSSHVKACLMRCDFATQEPCATGSQCARLSSDAPNELGVDGDFCFVPLATCNTDQRCDEPDWGSRVCQAGRDAADCQCDSSVVGGVCDLTKQCGCSPVTHCALGEVQGTKANLSCVPNSAQYRKPGALCNDETECGPGYSCWRGLCEKYCNEASDCAAGRCIPIDNPGEVSGVHICTIACTFSSEGECDTGSRCVHAPAGQDYCLIPRSPCPFTGDGSCDESKGTRICAEGTDTADCK